MCTPKSMARITELHGKRWQIFVLVVVFPIAIPKICQLVGRPMCVIQSICILQ